MPQELLHGAQVHPGHHQARGECVSQRVGRRMQDAGLLYGFAEPFTHYPILALGTTAARDYKLGSPRLPVQRFEGLPTDGIYRDGPPARFYAIRNIDNAAI